MLADLSTVTLRSSYWKESGAVRLSLGTPRFGAVPAVRRRLSSPVCAESEAFLSKQRSFLSPHISEKKCVAEKKTHPLIFERLDLPKRVQLSVFLLSEERVSAQLVMALAARGEMGVEACPRLLVSLQEVANLWTSRKNTGQTCLRQRRGRRRFNRDR